MSREQIDDESHTRRFGVVGLVIAVGELLARIIGADPGRDDPAIVLGLVALAGAAVLILRDDERGRSAWIMAGVVMMLYAVGRLLLIGRIWQTLALALLGIMLSLGAEQTLRPWSGTRRGIQAERVARSRWFVFALIPLALFALWPFGVSLKPEGALAEAARAEGYPVPAHEIVDRMSGDEKIIYYSIPNGCSVSAVRTGRFWHPGRVSCGGRGGGGDG